MHEHAELLNRFYMSFSAKKADEMCACYHPEVRFSDPVFPDLRGARAGAMWQMLCHRGKDLKLSFGEVEAEDAVGSAHWEAWYTFSGTGKHVHNVIDASFRFQDGLIIEHRDVFDLTAWCKQALGIPGMLFGGTGFLQGKVKAKADQGLDDWIAKRGLPTLGVRA
jgi:ketosteroid isomerase-like protein